jgi:hypothetical protein
MTNTVIPNAIRVAPNGRAKEATTSWSCGEELGLFTETRNSCTRAIYIYMYEIFLERDRRGGRWGRTDAGGCKGETGADVC